MNGVQQTSLWSYWGLKDLSQRQRQVYTVIQENGPISNQDIADLVNRPINQITGRTNELVDKGLVVEAYKAPSKQTNRTVIYWKINELL